MLVDAPLKIGGDATAGPAVEAEEARPAAHRAVENLVLVLFWLLLLEGSLRKWVLPEFARYLFFIRDPFVLLLYWYALRGGLFRQAGVWLPIGLIFAAIAPVLAFAQLTSFEDPRFFTLVVYGWRQYFLYLPLPFAIAAALDENSLWRFARHAFVAAILTAPLVFAQYHSPGGAVINRGIAEDESLQFKSFDLLGDKIRPSGSFTTTVGIGHLVPSTLALLLAAWLTPKSRRRIGTLMLLVTAGAVATCLALSGSRGAFGAVALVVLAAFGLVAVAPDAGVRGRALAIPAVLLVGGAVLYPIVFPDAFGVMLERTVAAQSTDSSAAPLGIVGRALYETVDFVRLMADAPLAGYGLGLGGNGRSFLGPGSDDFLASVYAESDWSRHIVDLGPVVGLLFVLYRIGLTFDLFRRAVRATRQSSNPFPLMLFGYLGLGIFYGQLTGHGTAGGFLWLYLGIGLASCRIAMERRE
jgi:hypothetical protein